MLTELCVFGILALKDSAVAERAKRSVRNSGDEPSEGLDGPPRGDPCTEFCVGRDQQHNRDGGIDGR